MAAPSTGPLAATGTDCQPTTSDRRSPTWHRCRAPDANESANHTRSLVGWWRQREGGLQDSQTQTDDHSERWPQPPGQGDGSVPSSVQERTRREQVTGPGRETWSSQLGHGTTPRWRWLHADDARACLLDADMETKIGRYSQRGHSPSFPMSRAGRPRPARAWCHGLHHAGGFLISLPDSVRCWQETPNFTLYISRCCDHIRVMYVAI